MAKYWYEVHEIAYDEVMESAGISVPVTGTKWMRTNGIDHNTGFYKNGNIDVWVMVKNVSYKYPFTSDSEPLASKRFEVLSLSQNNAIGNLYKIITQKGEFINLIKAEEDEYPGNGQSGNYWYVRGKKAFPSLKINGQTIGGAKIKDSTGQVRAVGNVYFKDSTGTVGNLK